MWTSPRPTGTQIWTERFLPDSGANVLHPEMLHQVISTLPAFHPFRNNTMAILNKKPMGIHNEWAQPNSFPWCEIALSTCNHWWLPNDKKHPHAFLINPSSLRARKSLYASDHHPGLETGNNVGATLEMLMPPAEEDSVREVNKTQAGTKGEGAIMAGFVSEVTADGASIHH